MAFSLPPFTPPDFSRPALADAPAARFLPVERAGVAPDGFHATSIFPEYVKRDQGTWELLRQSRMDCVIVQSAKGSLEVKELRTLTPGEQVAAGRTENGEEGIYVHTDGFRFPSGGHEKFVFRSHLTRETAFSIDYDDLYELLLFERDNGFVAWVAGPAVVFDRDSRQAFSVLIESGYVHAVLAGNALAAHDLEGAMFGTALGQELYSKRSVALGHYKHLDAINTIRRVGSIREALEEGLVSGGVMETLIRHRIPYVLAGSIRDDGPLPEVVANVCSAQDRMRTIVRKATTVIAMATQLHGIAVGNMTPSYTVLDDGTVRPVYFYSVDMSEFAVSKLANRGSLTAKSILTNVQDFVVTVERGLRKRG